MSRQKFRLLIILSWLLAVGAAIFSFSTERMLPPELKSYLDTQANTPITMPDMILTIISVVYLIFHFMVSVGLFLFKRWAKALFLPLLAIGSILIIPLGPYVDTGWATFLYYLCNLLDGITLAVVYFSPISRMFEVNLPIAR